MVIKDGAKMSKSKGNVVDPDEMIEAYGADTVRLFCLFASPPEKDLEWNDQGVEGAFRFLSRIWRLLAENRDSLLSVPMYSGGDALARDLASLHRKTHQTVKKVTEDIRERFHFNTAIAAVMELVNQIYQNLEGSRTDPHFWPVMREAVENMVLLVSPIVPHIAEELWKALGHEGSVITETWPKWTQEALVAEEVLIVVQVNGKLRSRVMIPPDASREETERAALNDPRIQEFIAGAPIKKVVVVPNKLINVVI
jgi:leucyl-tRNA synthetase